MWIKYLNKSVFVKCNIKGCNLLCLGNMYVFKVIDWIIFGVNFEI